MIRFSGEILIVIDGNGKFGCSFNDIKVAAKKFKVLNSSKTEIFGSISVVYVVIYNVLFYLTRYIIS